MPKQKATDKTGGPEITSMRTLRKRYLKFGAMNPHVRRRDKGHGLNVDKKKNGFKQANYTHWCIGRNSLCKEQ